MNNTARTTHMDEVSSPASSLRTNSGLNIIVIGTGPVGIRAARMLMGQNPSHKIMVFGEEPVTPYNRVQLSLYLLGEVPRDALDTLPAVTSEQVAPGFETHFGRKITHIDRKSRSVKDDTGAEYQYDKLILATGSRARLPDLPGNTLPNTFTFRTLEDTESLLARKKNSRSVYIVGSGPLGIEAALGMKTRDNRVYLQARNYLLDAALDERAQEILGDSLQTAGINVINNDNTRAILGHDHVIGVELESGRIIECDTVVFCTGVAANTLLAQSCGLEVARGVLVNDVMQTSDPHIYAVGECSEHRGQTYGVVAPGFEQVSSMVTHMSGQQMPYTGSAANIQLKFGSQSSGLIGQVRDINCETLVYANRLKGIYRKLFLKDQKLVGYIHIGSWSELPMLQQAQSTQARLKPKQLQQFADTGFLWEADKPLHIKDQPEDYIVCLCENVTRGTLSKAMESGNRTIDTLCTATRAGVTCGSCKPLLAEMLDAPAPNLVMRHYKSIYWFSIVAIALMLATVFLRPIGIGESAQLNWQLEKLWFDNFWKQVSGYTLLFLSMLAAGLGIRKRWKKLNYGHLDDWRYVHSVIGVIALVVLMIHTGLRLGHNLNFALMIVFLAATLTGSLVGVFMARNHHWTDLKLRRHRAWWSRVHYTLLWMLPALLTYHIIAVYFF
ncbi:FAD-dependent oxidoreductase [Simiduia sp. 21SJ11W-1]|uniref:FAD-dependent oxidoreductase n=1 Tax=Simiduia sp. 21SJ11W-1 TaxID=2909669 RepID=UPI00209CFBDC|nr:FAD-dependent oxidoreductase [Simiduia sp. 21SJ11W-1]UTA46926.1 FAD-dependent oxidoreductase [Simiduia sp. 21SJ11W-1]